MAKKANKFIQAIQDNKAFVHACFLADKVITENGEGNLVRQLYYAAESAKRELDSSIYYWRRDKKWRCEESVYYNAGKKIEVTFFQAQRSMVTLQEEYRKYLLRNQKELFPTEDKRDRSRYSYLDFMVDWHNDPTRVMNERGWEKTKGHKLHYPKESPG